MSSVPQQNPPRTNGFAVASLVLGIIGGVLLSVIFGIVGLVQIKRSGQRGKGLAISGLVLSGVWTVVFCMVGLFLIAAAPWRDEVAPAATPANTVRWNELAVGQCINGMSNGASKVYRLQLVPCTDPHEGEVYLTDEYPEDTYPVEEDMVAHADKICSEALDDRFPDLAENSPVEIMYIFPTDASFQAGDRQITCIGYSNNMLTAPLAEL